MTRSLRTSRIFSTRAATAVGATLLAAALASGAAATELRVTSQLPPTHPVTANLIEFADRVNEISGGELTFEIFHSAQLYKDNETPAAVSSGAVDMGTASLTQFAGTIPAVDIFYVPFTFKDAAAVDAATAQGSPVRGPIDEAILATGSRVLWWQAVGGAVIMSRDPIIMPSDMAGKKVRVFSKTLGTFVETLGGAAASISGSEQFLAYQQGTVDAGMSSAAGVTARKIYEVLDYMTVSNHADVEFVVLMNEGVWQGLTQQERDWIDLAGKEVEASLRATINQQDAEAIEFIKAETDMQVIELTPEQRAAWVEASKPVLESYLMSSGELGERLVKGAAEIQ